MKKGITLSESMIILTILGIISFIFIPKVIYKHQESLNRAKIKKSMAIYDDVITKISIDNDLRTEYALREWGKQTPDCKNSGKYFQPMTKSGCIIKTTNGVFWNIKDITKPVIAVSQKDLQAAGYNGTDGQRSFMLVTSFDSNVDALKINDLEFETQRLKNVLKTENQRFQTEIQSKYLAEYKADLQIKINELEKVYKYIAKSSGNNTSN